MIYAKLACDLRGAVARSIVDHKDLDLVDAPNLPRDVADRVRQRCFLIEAGNLYDQLQMSLPPDATVILGRLDHKQLDSFAIRVRVYYTSQSGTVRWEFLVAAPG